MTKQAKPIQSSSIRWPADLKAELEEIAKADDRDFSKLVIHTMRNALPELRKRVRSRKS